MTKIYRQTVCHKFHTIRYKFAHKIILQAHCGNHIGMAMNRFESQQRTRIHLNCSMHEQWPLLLLLVKRLEMQLSRQTEWGSSNQLKQWYEKRHSKWWWNLSNAFNTHTSPKFYELIHLKSLTNAENREFVANIVPVPVCACVSLSFCNGRQNSHPLHRATHGTCEFFLRNKFLL